ncbi:ATP-binding protein [Aliiglaciecola sp.]|nr:ATP-binding protein [Aliiglaciecola sp.]
MVGANQEITQKVKAEKEQQKLQSQLLQSQRLEAIGTLAGGIAHDFNNLLVPILAMTENVQQVLPPSSDESKKLDVVIRSAQRAKELVSQILTSSKQSEFKREPIFLDEVTLEALTFLRSTIPQRISIKKNINPGHPAILGDSTQIHQIIVNLCINAVHAMPEEGQLTISVDTVLNKHKNIHSEFVCLTIQDNGCGMDENTQNRIFEPFFSTKDTQQGTGLGLPIVMGIVEQHGGRIEVESAVGRGSVFRIYFEADTDNKKCEDKKITEF